MSRHVYYRHEGCKVLSLHCCTAGAMACPQDCPHHLPPQDSLFDEMPEQDRPLSPPPDGDRPTLPSHALDQQTLLTARDWLLARVEAGERCPCCGQFAKVYRRKVNSAMARALISLYKVGNTTTWVHVRDIPNRTHETGQLVWWRLIEEENTVREDGGRAGYWRVTERGRAFVFDRLSIPKYAHIYDSRVLRLAGDPVSIRDALGNPFDYRELMAGL